MFKKILKFVLYSVAIFFIIAVGSAILIGVFVPDSEEDGGKSSPEISIERVDKSSPEISAEEVGDSNREISGGSITGSSYYHPPSGWRFQIPEGWQVQDAELAQKLYQESKDMVESATGERVPQVSKPSGELALVHSSGNTLNYKYQEYDKERFPEFELMVQHLYQTSISAYMQSVAQAGHEVRSQRVKTNVGKIEFDNLQISIQDSQTKNVLLTNNTYVAEINGLSAMITFSGTSEEIWSTMNAAITSSVFDSTLSESRKLFYNAVDELNRNNPQGTYNLISQAIEIEPEFGYYYILRADAASRIEGYRDNYLNDVDKAEQLYPSIPDIYYFRAKDAEKTGDTFTYYLNLHKSNLFNKLSSENKRLPQNIFGVTEREFTSLEGVTGYIQSGLTLDFKEVLPLPIVGEKADVVYNKLEVVDNFGTIKCSDNLPVAEKGYEITAYNLLTAFEDSSGQFYQLYYQVKYKLN